MEKRSCIKEQNLLIIAPMVELADTPVLEAGAARHGSSSLPWGTKIKRRLSETNITLGYGP
jgi:hypothetical protein